MSETISYHELKSEYAKIQKKMKKVENDAEDLKHLFNMSADLLHVEDINGLFQKINPAFTKILGYKEEELLNKPFLDFVHPEDKEKTLCVIKPKLKFEDPVFHFENRFLCKDGTYKVLEWTSKQISSKGITYTVGRFINERKRPSQVLEYLDNKNVIMVVLDENGNVGSINKKGCEILGYPEIEIIGKNWFESFLPNINRQEVKKIYQILMKGNTEFTNYYENEILTKNGTECFVAWYNTIIVDNYGEITGILSIGIDITEQNRTEKKLIESEEKFLGLFDNMAVGFAYNKIILDNDGIPVDYEFIDINSMFTQLTGLPRENTIGKRVTEILPGIENEPAGWIEKYGKVALEDLKISFESYSEVLNKWYLVNAYSNKKGFFVTVFIDISDRKKYEEELIESEMKFRLISEQSLLGLVILQDNIVKYANDALSNLIEYSLEEMMNWKPGEFSKTFHPDHKDLVMKQAQKKQLGEKGVIINYSFKCFTKTGKIKWLEVYSYTVSYFGKPADFATVIDITEKMRTEVALKNSEKKYRNLIETMNEGMGITDKNDELTYVNPKLSQMMGYHFNEMIGRKIYDFFDERDKKLVKNDRSLLEKGYLKAIELKWIKKGGGSLYTITTPQPIFDEKGTYFGSSAVVTDITERKNLEIELSYTNDLFKNIFSATSTHFAYMDKMFNFLKVNNAYANMAGHSVDFFTGKNHFDLYPNEEAEEIFQSVIDTGESFHTKSRPFTNPDQTEQETTYWDWTLIPIKDAHNKVQTLLLSLYNVTERKKLELDMQQQAEILKKILIEKDTLLKELHHRVKNNLQIISAISIMQEENLDKNTRKIFKDFQSRIKAMAKIHETLYKSEDIGQLKINEYISNLIDNLILSYKTNTKRIKIKLDIEEINFDLRIAMYYGLIINELISNSLKYAFPNNRAGKIIISTKKNDDNSIVLKIKDNGIGIPDEIDYLSPETMGLKIVSILTKQLKGTISLNRGKGTEWIITFREFKKMINRDLQKSKSKQFSK
jgi:PAS domain S-box-containing protein